MAAHRGSSINLANACAAAATAVILYSILLGEFCFIAH